MAADILELAFQAFECGKTEEARQMCEVVLAGQPNQPFAAALAGLIAMNERKFEEAALLLERSVSSSPHPQTIMNLASCLWRTGQLERGLSYIEDLISRFPDRAETYLMGANLLHGLSRYDLALEWALRAEQLNPNSHMIEARLGCLMSQLGRYDEAEQRFRNTVRMKPLFVQCNLINFGQDHWREIDPYANNPPAPVSEMTHTHSSGQYYDAVVVACCDARYFYKYGAAFVNSFVRNASRDKLLHLHIVDPDERFEEYVDELDWKLKPPNLVVTSEDTPKLIGSSKEARRTYYSCARFLRMNEWLDRYQTPVACFDIDTVFESPLEDPESVFSRAN